MEGRGARRRPDGADALAAGVRAARARAAMASRLGSGAAHRAVVRRRRRFRGRGVLLAHPGRVVARGLRRRSGRHRARERRGCAGRATRRRAAGIRRRAGSPAGDRRGRGGRGGNPSFRRRARLARARAVAAAGVPAVARELGAVARRTRGPRARKARRGRFAPLSAPACARLPLRPAACAATSHAAARRGRRQPHRGPRNRARDRAGSRGSGIGARGRATRRTRRRWPPGRNARARTPSFPANRRSSLRRREVGTARPRSSCGGRCAAHPRFRRSSPSHRAAAR